MSLNVAVIGVGRKGFNLLIGIYYLCHGSLKKKIGNTISLYTSIVKIWVYALNAVYLLTELLFVRPVERRLLSEINGDTLRIRNHFEKNRKSSINYYITSEEKRGSASNAGTPEIERVVSFALNVLKHGISKRAGMPRKRARDWLYSAIKHSLSYREVLSDAFVVDAISTMLLKSTIKMGRVLRNLRPFVIVHSINKFLTTKETILRLPVRCVTPYIMLKGGLASIG